jgi:hypothetical protein
VYGKIEINEFTFDIGELPLPCEKVPSSLITD